MRGRQSVHVFAALYLCGLAAASQGTWRVSLASVPNDTNACSDVFVFDLQTRLIERRSVTWQGAQADLASRQPSLSVDGRFVAFHSVATNLVPADTNQAGDIFVRDALAATTERASLTSAGGQSDGVSVQPRISADGRCVAFSSLATNLVTADTNAASDVFGYDRQTHVVVRVSVDSSGQQGNLGSDRCAISSDGRFIAFASAASNLTPADTNGWSDVFLHDVQAGITRRMSASATGGLGNWNSGEPSVSAEGRFVAFHSDAANLVTGDTNVAGDVFVRGRFLILQADPENPAAGATLGFTTFHGKPGELAVLLLDDGNGVLFKILSGRFDAAGVWTVAGTVPPHLSGYVLDFAVAGFAPDGKGELTNREVVRFQ